MLISQNVEMLVLVAAVVPNPPPSLPPGLDFFSDTIIGWLKGGLAAAGVVGLLICSLMVILGRRNRNQMATEGVLSAVWVAGGLVLGSSAALLVAIFI